MGLQRASQEKVGLDSGQASNSRASTSAASSYRADVCPEAKFAGGNCPFSLAFQDKAHQTSAVSSRWPVPECSPHPFLYFRLRHLHAPLLRLRPPRVLLAKSELRGESRVPGAAGAPRAGQRGSTHLRRLPKCLFSGRKTSSGLHESTEGLRSATFQLFWPIHRTARVINGYYWGVSEAGAASCSTS